MKSLVISAALAAVVATTSLAFADQSSGTIKTFDATAHSLTLQDGNIFYLPQNFQDPGLKAGERVNITWSMDGSKRMASVVTVQ